MALNNKTFTILIGTMAAVIGVLAVILVVNMVLPGLFAGLVNGQAGEDIIVVEETGPWGEKYYEWTYLGTDYHTSLTVSKDAYKQANCAFGGSELQQYIAEDSDGTILNLAYNLEYLAMEQGMKDREIIDFIVAFVQSIAYETDKDSGHQTAYPRAPVVTLADEVGDSTDLSILAASLIDSLGYSVALLHYEQSYHSGLIVPAASSIALPAEYSSTMPLYTFTENSAAQTVAVIWVADTESLGFPAEAYFVETPAIIPAPGFWTGISFDKKETASLPTAEIFQIPNQDIHLDVSWNSWKRAAEKFYEKKWYNTGISWNSEDRWILYEHILDVTPTPASEPSEDGILPGSLWRLSYSVQPTVSLEAGDGKYSGMSPFASAEIAVYDMSSGEPVLIDKLGWQGSNSANNQQTSPVYPPGKYAIGLFVRNAEVEITVQCSDDLHEVIYLGGI